MTAKHAIMISAPEPAAIPRVKRKLHSLSDWRWLSRVVYFMWAADVLVAVLCLRRLISSWLRICLPAYLPHASSQLICRPFTCISLFYLEFGWHLVYFRHKTTVTYLHYSALLKCFFRFDFNAYNFCCICRVSGPELSGSLSGAKVTF